MRQEIFYFEGNRAKPLVIFIHGMGMDADMWVEPTKARVMGGKYPLSILIEGKELQSSFHDLKAKGYSVLTWSQRRPAGPVRVSVDELGEIIGNYNSNSDVGIILVGHSKGGLIARLFLQECYAPVRGMITIGTPVKRIVYCEMGGLRLADHDSPQIIYGLEQQRSEVGHVSDIDLSER